MKKEGGLLKINLFQFMCAYVVCLEVCFDNLYILSYLGKLGSGLQKLGVCEVRVLELRERLNQISLLGWIRVH